MGADRDLTMPDVPDVYLRQENAVLQGRLQILEEENQALRSGVQALGENLEQVESSLGSIVSDQGKLFRKMDSRPKGGARTLQIIPQTGDQGVIPDLMQEPPPLLGASLSLPEAKEVKVDVISFQSQQQKLLEAEQV